MKGKVFLSDGTSYEAEYTLTWPGPEVQIEPRPTKGGPLPVRFVPKSGETISFTTETKFSE